MTAHPSLMRAWCRADKAVMDRIYELLGYFGPAALRHDSTLRRLRREASTLHRKLPENVRAAVLDPMQEGD